MRDKMLNNNKSVYNTNSLNYSKNVENHLSKTQQLITAIDSCIEFRENINIICLNYMREQYNIILEKFAKLCNELKLRNSLEISNLFTHLLWNGFFSQNKKFQYQIEDRMNIRNSYALDIMNGIGVCLNISDMLADLLILKVDSLTKSSMINGTGIIVNRFDESYSHISNAYNQCLLDDLRYGDNQCPYNFADFKDSWHNILEQFDENFNLMNDYHNDIQKNIDNIAGKVKQLIK